jgi:hypothetical protein
MAMRITAVRTNTLALAGGTADPIRHRGRFRV